MGTIQNSLKLLHLEKLLVIKKEIAFIENILKYYKGYEEHTITVSKATINKLLNDIDSLKSRIEHLENIHKGQLNTILEVERPLNFILFYDYVKIEIEEMLLVIEALYDKMNQLFGEMLNQYLPYPTFFGRRYSSVGLMMYLDNYYKIVLDKLNSSKNKLVLGWSYNSGFKHKILRNRDIRRVDYDYMLYNDYIELPYWYYELPFLIPAITHKVATIALRSRTSIFRSEYEKFEQTLIEFFQDKSNILVRAIGDILGYKTIVKELSRDIFADIVAYKIHGFSYLLTIFHNLLGENIAKDFLEIHYSNKSPKERYEIRANDWIFSAKREHNLLRLYLLSWYANFYADSLQKKYIKEMLSFLDTIMVLDDEKDVPPDGFEYYFAQNNPGNMATYNAVKIYMQELFALLQGLFVSLNLSTRALDCITTHNNTNGVGVDFWHLWEDRFETIEENHQEVPYKGKFRIEIHKNLSGIKFQEDIPIKVLTLRKVRKDLVNKVYREQAQFQELFQELQNATRKDDIKETYNKIEKLESYLIIKNYIQNIYTDSCELSSEQTKRLFNYLRKIEFFSDIQAQKEETIFYLLLNEDKFSALFLKNLEKTPQNSQNISKWIAYGIYDFAYLEEKEKKVNLYQPNLQKAPLDCNLYYFDSKSMLMQVEEPIGKKPEPKGFTLIANIELRKALSSENLCRNKALMTGYRDLKGAIEAIKKALEEYEDKMGQATIYKSLGPKDITVIVEDASLEVLYNIIQDLNAVKEVNRTFTVFCSQSLSAPLEGYKVSSFIRMPKNSKIFSKELENSQVLSTFKEIANKEHTINLITGVMDIEIEWSSKEIASMGDLFDNYKKLIPFMTDYQTKIEKRFF